MDQRSRQFLWISEVDVSSHEDSDGEFFCAGSIFQ